MISGRRSVTAVLSGLVFAPLAAGITRTAYASSGSTALPVENPLMKAPPPAPFEAASKLLKLPEFLPGIGTLYVDPKTLPLGPWLAYDHEGTLVSTIYMVPIADIDAHKTMDSLKAFNLPVVDVDFFYTHPHPGVPVPHYHVGLWHVANGRERVAH